MKSSLNKSSKFKPGSTSTLSIRKKKPKASVGTYMYSKIPDFFGKRINLLYDNKSEFKTGCGRIATMILIFFVLAALVNEGSRVLNEDLVNLIQYETNRQNLPLEDNIPLSPFNHQSDNVETKSLFGAIRLNNEDHVLNEHLIVELPATAVDVDCSESNYKEEITHFSSLKNIICFKIPIKTINDIDLNSPITFKWCSSPNCFSTLENGAPTQDTVVNIDIGVEMETGDTTMNTPQFWLRWFNSKTTASILKRKTFTLIEHESMTSSSFGSFGSLHFLTLLFKSYNESIIGTMSSGKSFFEIIIEIDHIRKVVTTRQIYQFKHLIAFLGGLLKGLSILFLAVIYPFREIEYYCKLVNEMFRVCDSPKTLKDVTNSDHVIKKSFSSRFTINPFGKMDSPSKGEASKK